MRRMLTCRHCEYSKKWLYLQMTPPPQQATQQQQQQQQQQSNQQSQIAAQFAAQVAATLKQGAQPSVHPNMQQTGSQQVPMPVHPQQPQMQYGVPPPVVQPATEAVGAVTSHANVAPTVTTSNAEVVASSALSAASETFKPAPVHEEVGRAQSESKDSTGEATASTDNTDTQASSSEPEQTESAKQEAAQGAVTGEQEMPVDNKAYAQRPDLPKVSPEIEHKLESEVKTETSSVVDKVPHSKSKDSTPEPQHVSHDTIVQDPVPPVTAISELPAESSPAESGAAGDRSLVERVKESTAERSLSRESSPVPTVTTPSTVEPTEQKEPQSKSENGFLESASDDIGKFSNNVS